jgi:hypothetical protein
MKTVVTSLKGNRIQIHNSFINGNNRFAIRATSPSINTATVLEETEPGTFISYDRKARVRFAPDSAEIGALREQATADAAATRQRRRDEAAVRHAVDVEEEQRLGKLLEWANGRSFGIMNIGAATVAESWLEAELKQRGIEIKCDWDAYYSKSARVPAAICDEIVQHYQAAVARQNAKPRAFSLGAQLWEPCERCGSEPSYDQPSGHLCDSCARKYDR